MSSAATGTRVETAGKREFLFFVIALYLRQDNKEGLRRLWRISSSSPSFSSSAVKEETSETMAE